MQLLPYGLQTLSENIVFTLHTHQRGKSEATSHPYLKNQLAECIFFIKCLHILYYDEKIIETKIKFKLKQFR